MKSFLKEFKEFIAKGNVMDLAVGVIIGAAFQSIVNSFVNDLVMPLIGLVTGGVNFNNQFIILKLPDGVTESQVTSLDVATELGVTTFNYGSFLTAVLNFLIMALVIFAFIKAVNKMTSGVKKEEAPAAPTTKTCDFCKSEISIEATRCPFCTSILAEEPKLDAPTA